MSNQKKYLFVCRHNFTRSRYGAEYFLGFLKARGIDARVISAGVGWTSIFFGHRVTKKRLRGVDKIFVMEKYMKDWIFKRFDFDKKNIIVLNIPDEYGIFGFMRYTIEDLNKRFGKVNWKRYI